MSALKGSLSYARSFVEGELPDGFRERFMKAIRLRSMKPLDPDDDAAERSGWCVIGEPFEIDLHYETVFYNSYINLGFRTDRWVIPAPLLRARVREAEAAYLEKKGRERLSKREKTEIKTLMARKLRKQFVPTTRMVDLSWSLDEGLVRFFSQSVRTAGTMSELFTKTFGQKLVPESPYTLAARAGMSKVQESAWDALEVTRLGASAEG